MAGNRGWIGVDLDGTLATYHGWNNGVIGDPIPAMQKRVKKWIREGKEVKIFTARVSTKYSHPQDHAWMLARIEGWCFKHLGKILPVTHEKDFRMIRLYDDRAVGVETNTGKLIGELDEF